MKKFLPVVMSIAAVVIGIIFAVSGIKTIAEKDLYDTEITATVVDVQEEWETSGDPDDTGRLVRTAYIDYEVNGKKFEHVLAPEQNNNIKTGDTVNILVQSGNPEKISALNPAKGGAVFIAAGALAAVIGCVSAVRFIIKKR